MPHAASDAAVDARAPGSDAAPDGAAFADPLRALARRTDPADPGAQNNLGVLLHRRGRPDEALAAFSRALTLDPAMRLARRNLAVAADETTSARREGELRRRVRLDGADADARRELARLLSALGRHDEARGELDAVVALRPDDVGVLVERARVEQAAGAPEAAVATLERARALMPNGATVHALLAEATYQAGDPAGALAHVEEALRLTPEDPHAQLLHGFLLGELGRTADGVAAAARAAALDPSLARADANLALPAPPARARDSEAMPPPRVLHAVAAAHGATTTASGRPEREPPEAHLALGHAFRHKGYLEEAGREYRRASTKGAPVGAVARALAELHLLAGEPAAAEAEWERATAHAPDDATAWLGRAGAAHLAGRAEAAHAAYARALALAPSRSPCAAWAQNGLGLLRWASGDVAGAAGAFAAAADLLASPHASPTTSVTGAAREGETAPGLVPVRLNHATALAALGERPRALALVRDVVRAAPARADAWTLLGTLLAEAGRPADARIAFARALDADAEDVAARYGLAFAAAALGEHDVARRETERALARTPVVPGRRLHLVLDLGTPTEFTVRAPEAAPTAAAIAGFALDEESADALVADLLVPDGAERRDEADGASHATSPFALADEHLAHADLDRAEAAIVRALRLGAPRAEALARLGAVFARRGLFGEALERFAEARVLDPRSRAATLGAVRMLREVGRLREASASGAALAAEWPQDGDALALAALAHADAGEVDAALDLLARAAVRARGADAWRDVGAAWRALGDASAAAAAQARVVELRPADPRERLALAHAQRAAGDVDAAEHTLRALVADAPTLADAAVALALACAERGARREAVQLLADVAARDPWHVDALAHLGAVLADAGRARDAATAAARVRRLDPEHALALAVEGDCRAAAGDRTGAVTRWRAALALEPVGAGAARARAGLRAAGVRE